MEGLRRLDGEVCAASFGGFTWFLLHSWRGLLVYFSNDDIMNLYWAREVPFWKLALSALVPFTTVYRPTGAVLYRCLYAIFGLNPLPFRIVFYALLLISLIVLYKLVGAITGLRSAGVQATFIASFHGRFSDLYMDNGTIYDVLCGCFYFGTLYDYISIRSRGLTLDWRHIIVLYFLATAALNSKEMAATLPVVFLFYELFLHSWQLAPLAIIGFVVAIGTWARFRDTSRLMHNDLYALHLSLGLPNIAGYLNDLFYLRAGLITELTAILILMTLFAKAALARSRVLLFWALFGRCGSAARDVHCPPLVVCILFTCLGLGRFCRDSAKQYPIAGGGGLSSGSATHGARSHPLVRSYAEQ
jgi:hypothetical protein